ncbi:MAG TPA: FkbM family methyltransferase [Bryobacteraceae bacterium]|jgi:FkbM family methyltransferase
MLNRMGMLDRPVDFRLSDSLKILVPIARIPWDEFDVANYETALMEALRGFVAGLPAPVTLIDGGADIGLFSLKMLTLCPGIRRIVAFEPNPDGFVWLQQNLSRLSVATEALPKAVSDFEGQGQLEAPSAEIEELAGFPMDHTAYFLVPSENGSIPVTTVDALSLPAGGNLILKLDIEGGEKAALKGAERTVREAAQVVVVIEAHPLVTRRIGIDPVECLRLLESWRPFSFIAGETGAKINTERPIFEQIPPDRIYNIICSEA